MTNQTMRQRSQLAQAAERQLASEPPASRGDYSVLIAAIVVFLILLGATA